MKRLVAALLLGPLLAGCLGPDVVGGAQGSGRVVFLDNERIEMGAGGGWAMQGFQLAGPATVRYDTESRNDDSYDVCIIDDKEAEFWKDGDAARGWACNGEVSRAADAASLGRGAYSLALRCRNLVERCVLAVSLTAQA